MLISSNDFYPVFCLHFFFLIEKITKGKKTPVNLLEHIFMGRQIFWIPVYFCLFYFWKFNLHIFLIIVIIMRCSGMFHVPGFIDGVLWINNENAC